jgi:hypothetical protein
MIHFCIISVSKNLLLVLIVNPSLFIQSVISSFNILIPPFWVLFKEHDDMLHGNFYSEREQREKKARCFIYQDNIVDEYVFKYEKSENNPFVAVKQEDKELLYKPFLKKVVQTKPLNEKR